MISKFKQNECYEIFLGALVITPAAILMNSGKDVAPCSEPRKDSKRISNAPVNLRSDENIIPVTQNPKRGDYKDGTTSTNWAGREHDSGPMVYTQYHQ